MDLQKSKAECSECQPGAVAERERAGWTLYDPLKGDFKHRGILMTSEETLVALNEYEEQQDALVEALKEILNPPRHILLVDRNHKQAYAAQVAQAALHKAGEKL